MIDFRSAFLNLSVPLSFLCLTACVSTARPVAEPRAPVYLEQMERGGDEDGIGGTGLQRPVSDPYAGQAKPRLGPDSDGTNGACRGRRSSCLGIGKSMKGR